MDGQRVGIEEIRKLMNIWYGNLYTKRRFRSVNAEERKSKKMYPVLN
jgi:hypothetical protein